LAKTAPHVVLKGEILEAEKTPMKLMIKYGVHAMNHREIVIKAICETVNGSQHLLQCPIVA
jgi:hypothetical protein